MKLLGVAKLIRSVPVWTASKSPIRSGKSHIRVFAFESERKPLFACQDVRHLQDDQHLSQIADTLDEASRAVPGKRLHRLNLQYVGEERGKPWQAADDGWPVGLCVGLKKTLDCFAFPNRGVRSRASLI